MSFNSILYLSSFSTNILKHLFSAYSVLSLYNVNVRLFYRLRASLLWKLSSFFVYLGDFGSILIFIQYELLISMCVPVNCLYVLFVVFRNIKGWDILKNEKTIISSVEQNYWLKSLNKLIFKKKKIWVNEGDNVV